MGGGGTAGGLFCPISGVDSAGVVGYRAERSRTGQDIIWQCVYGGVVGRVGRWVVRTDGRSICGRSVMLSVCQFGGGEGAGGWIGGLVPIGRARKDVLSHPSSTFRPEGYLCALSVRLG